MFHICVRDPNLTVHAANTDYPPKLWPYSPRIAQAGFSRSRTSRTSGFASADVAGWTAAIATQQAAATRRLLPKPAVATRALSGSGGGGGGANLKAAMFAARLKQRAKMRNQFHDLGWLKQQETAQTKREAADGVARVICCWVLQFELNTIPESDDCELPGEVLQNTVRCCSSSRSA